MKEFYRNKPLDYINDSDEGLSKAYSLEEELEFEANKINAMLDKIRFLSDDDSSVKKTKESEAEKRRLELYERLDKAFRYTGVKAETQVSKDKQQTIKTETTNTTENIEKESNRQELIEQLKKEKIMLDETKDAKLREAEFVQMQGYQETQPVQQNQEISNEEVRSKIIVGIIQLENPDIDFNYVFLPDVMKRFDGMSMQELAEYRDSLIDQLKGRAM